MPAPRDADLEALDELLRTPLAERLARCRADDPAARALETVRRVRREVPAYAEYLEYRGVEAIESLSDAPLVTKADYVRGHALSERTAGRPADLSMVAVSSGSTGEPVVWPRSLRHEAEVAFRFEQVFHDGFRADERTTLAVVCFPLGTWVGGMFTAACCRLLALKGYPITVATPGNKPEEIFRTVLELAPGYEQLVLLGYPPFMKGVLDRGAERGIDWAAHGTKLVFAGEVFSEAWRDLVCARIGAEAPHLATASLYGTADSGVLGNETPLSVLIRRFFADHPDAARARFGESRLPTLVQYDPMDRYFEVHEDTLVVTADGGVPLARYHIADHGGVTPYAAMLEAVREAGGDPEALVAAAGERGARELPFVHVFGRADFTVSFFGANVYPENISVGLEQAPISEWCSGKFVLWVCHDDDEPELSLAVELLPGVPTEAASADEIEEAVLAQLLRLNSEFAHYVPARWQRPRVTLHENGDATWFPVGIKHRYTRH